MAFLNDWLLTILIFLPLAGAVAVLLAPTRQSVRRTALFTTALTFLLSLLLLVAYNWRLAPSADAGEYAYHASHAFGVVQLVQRADWIPAFHVQYLVGVDGLSLPLVILSTFVCLLACIASWNVEKMLKGYMALFLLLETGILGVFLSLDFFLFYVFFEVSLLPMYFLIGVWGGSRKEYAAIKFFLYTLVGSVALLIVLIGTYLYCGTFDLIQLASPEMSARFGPAGPLFGAGKAFFILLMVGFLIKVPAVPFHTWLPDAHVEAPTPISMILAALLLKMGGYGIFRLAYPMFPDAAKALWLVIAIIGVVGIVYGALVTLAQTDFKRLVAYSSVSHMGFVVLGAAVMTAAATNGALFMMVAHGITSAMMFFIVGVLYQRTHHRELNRFGGIATSMPLYTGFSTVAMFANLGLPGLCGFIGEVLVLLGVFQAARPDSILRAAGLAGASSVYALAIIATSGVLLAAAYMLWTLQRIFFGPLRPQYRALPDLDSREILILTPLAIMAILLGILPSAFFFVFTNQTVAAFMKLLS
jgi:NADH-quinone oxidoreductase subunit M